MATMFLEEGVFLVEFIQPENTINAGIQNETFVKSHLKQSGMLTSGIVLRHDKLVQPNSTSKNFNGTFSISRRIVLI